MPAAGGGRQEQQPEASFSVMGSVQVLGKRILSPARAKARVLVKDIESPQLLTYSWHYSLQAIEVSYSSAVITVSVTAPRQAMLRLLTLKA